MPYRDDAAALFARVQALEAELARLRDAPPAPAPAERGPLAAAAPRTAAWMTTLVERLPAAQQALVGELVTLFVTRRDYPSLDAVSAAALEPWIARLRAALA